MTAPIESLKKLHTVLIDIGQGYDEALKEASEDRDSSAFAPLFREMKDLHGKAHTELHQLLIQKGETPDDSGSVMSTVHRVAIDLRANITGLNEALPAFIGGEERVLGEYDDAIKDASGDSQASAILLRQKESLQGQIAKMKTLQAA